MNDDPIRLSLTYEPPPHLATLFDVNATLWKIRAVYNRVDALWGLPASPGYPIDHSSENAEWARYLAAPKRSTVPLELSRRDPDPPLHVEALYMGSPLELVVTIAPYVGTVTTTLALVAGIEKYWNAPCESSLSSNCRKREKRWTSSMRYLGRLLPIARARCLWDSSSLRAPFRYRSRSILLVIFRHPSRTVSHVGGVGLND